MVCLKAEPFRSRDCWLCNIHRQGLDSWRLNLRLDQVGVLLQKKNLILYESIPLKHSHRISLNLSLRGHYQLRPQPKHNQSRRMCNFGLFKKNVLSTVQKKCQGPLCASHETQKQLFC